MSARLLRILAGALLGWVVAATAVPAEADAQTRGQIRRARVLFARGIRQFDRHRYTAALRTFTRAYQLAPAPPIVFNMAQCHQALGNDERAVESYRLFLQLAPDAPNRVEVERKIRQLEAHIAAEHRRQQRELVREVSREQERISDQERVETEEEERSGSGSVGLFTWITLGTGALTTGVGLLFHLDAVAQQDALDDPQLDCRRKLQRCVDIVDAGDRSAMLRTILLSAGGALVVSGVIMMIVDLGSPDEEERSIGRTGTPSLARSLTLAPLLAPGLASLEVRGTW